MARAGASAYGMSKGLVVFLAVAKRIGALRVLKTPARAGLPAVFRACFCAHFRGFRHPF